MMNKVSFPLLSVYSLPVLSTIMFVLPLGSIMPAYYSEHTSITMASIGMILVVSRIIDAITDPIIGYLSDRTKTPIGRRKPWMIAGGILAMICARPLFIPPPDAGIFYFAFWSICAYQAWTLISIPHNAWASELSTDYVTKSKVFAFRNMTGSVGSFFLLLMPLALYPITKTTAMGPENMYFLPWIIIICTPIFILLPIFFVSEGEYVSTQAAGSLFDSFKAIKGNKLFWKFMIVSVTSGLATGIDLSLYFLVMDNYLKLGEQFSMLTAVYTMSAIVFMPFWIKMVKKFGKPRPWALAMMARILIFPMMLLIEPGPSALIPFFLVSLFNGFVGSCSLVVPHSMVSDIVDVDLLKTGVNKTANYFAILGFVSKANMAIGGGLAFLLLSMFGYDAKAVVNESFANIGLMISYAGIPGVVAVIAGLVIWNFPLDAKQHAIIRRKIEKREEQAKNKVSVQKSNGSQETA